MAANRRLSDDATGRPLPPGPAIGRPCSESDPDCSWRCPITHVSDSAFCGGLTRRQHRRLRASEALRVESGREGLGPPPRQAALPLHLLLPPAPARAQWPQLRAQALPVSVPLHTQAHPLTLSLCPSLCPSVTPTPLPPSHPLYKEREGVGGGVSKRKRARAREGAGRGGNQGTGIQVGCRRGSLWALPGDRLEVRPTRNYKPEPGPVTVLRL
jgi:hypothetical protein